MSSPELQRLQSLSAQLRSNQGQFEASASELADRAADLAEMAQEKTQEVLGQGDFFTAYFYYEHNAFFWAKLGTFALIGLLSVPPTLAYLRWRREGGAPDPQQVAGVRRLLWAEVLLFALLPIFAAAMARGYGELTG